MESPYDSNTCSDNKTEKNKKNIIGIHPKLESQNNNNK